MTIYTRVLKDALAKGLISHSDSVLAVCAGRSDMKVFLNENFENVTITNLEFHAGVSDYDPYTWERQDAESLSRDDDSVDWVAVHAGLHHCGSPHKAMCEMLRVARKGIMVVEARDSKLMRLANRFGFAREYELEPIALTKGTAGGFRNTEIPNFVYRWTEREIEKTANSFSPMYQHQFFYYYGYRVPLQRLMMSPSVSKRMLARIFQLMLPAIKTIFRRQGNEFGFVISKTGPLHPWLTRDTDQKIVPDMPYINSKINTESYES